MKAIPLATEPNAAQIESLRPLVQGRSCVLVGSAPLTAPVVVDADDVVVPINGGISLAPRADVWFVGSKQHDKPSQHLFWRPLHRQMLEQAKGRRAAHAVFLRGPKSASEPYTLETLRRLGCAVEAWSVIDKPTKRWLEKDLCARHDLQPCSSGILAAACALYCDAASVRLVGFSLAPGYHYVRNEPPQRWWRDHVAADARAIESLLRRYGTRLSGSIVEMVAA